MSYQKLPQRGLRRSAFALIALLAHTPAFAEESKPDQGQTKKQDLQPLVVSALRTPQPASTVTSSVAVLDPEELQNQGILQLRDALNQSPGVISTSTAGQLGAVSSLYIRGTTTDHSQVVLDGMRLSDSTNLMGNFLSTGHTYDLGNIEVLRGAQGAIYGGESIGGVLWLETPHGTGDPHGSTTFEAGSFSSLETHSTFQGQTGPVSYFLSGGYQESNNDGPQQFYHQSNTALRVEGQLDPVWTIGTTFRASESYFENSGTSDEYVKTLLSTIYATGKISEVWTARFLFGYYQELYDSLSPYPPYGTQVRDGSFSTDHEIKLADNLRLLAGAYFNRSDYQSTSGTEESRDHYGAYSALEWEAIQHLTFSGALRLEHYETFGDKATWRIGSVYNVEQTGTSIKGGVGTSFRSPSYVDLYGSTWVPGNPNLNPESSLGWEAGVEQKIGSHHTAELTYFHNQITDHIQTSWSAPSVNIPGKSDTDGTEFAVRGDWFDGVLSYRLAWTWLHQSLKDQPRNAATASLDWKPTPKILLGIGAAHLSDHSWGGDALDAYTVARIYGTYQITDKVKLLARVENLFNENYELFSTSYGAIKGSGTGFYAGVTMDW